MIVLLKIQLVFNFPRLSLAVSIERILGFRMEMEGTPRAPRARASEASLEAAQKVLEDVLADLSSAGAAVLSIFFPAARFAVRCSGG